MKIKITADSTCDLSPELVERYNIEVAPLYIIKDGKSFLDGKEIKPEDIFNHVKAGGDICSTAAVSLADYLDIFGTLRKEYDAIIHLNISSEMSACHQNAMLAAAEISNVYPVDSRNLSTGIGHLVIVAAELAAQGMEAPAIKTELENLRDKLEVSFVLDTLSFLHKGGRCSAVAALGANLLSLKPCIEVKNGKMGVGKKYRGSLKKSLVTYVQDRLNGRNDIDTRRIFITDSGVDDELYSAVEETVRSCMNFDEIYHTQAGCTVSNHCGPNCLGILFFTK